VLLIRLITSKGNLQQSSFNCSNNWRGMVDHLVEGYRQVVSCPAITLLAESPVLHHTSINDFSHRIIIAVNIDIFRHWLSYQSMTLWWFFVIFLQ
jgi:hypothetical protein